jgi:hypothetical protein
MLSTKLICATAKYPHQAARGIGVAVRALLAVSPNDHLVLFQDMALVDGF